MSSIGFEKPLMVISPTSRIWSSPTDSLSVERKLIWGCRADVEEFGRLQVGVAVLFAGVDAVDRHGSFEHWSVAAGVERALEVAKRPRTVAMPM